jgi:hypothetical protein
MRFLAAGEVDAVGCGRLSVHDGLLNVAWLCVCKLCDSLTGEMNIRFVVVVGASASALGDRRVCVEVLIRVTNMHDMTLIHMLEDDVTRPEHAVVI